MGSSVLKHSIEARSNLVYPMRTFVMGVHEEMYPTWANHQDMTTYEIAMILEKNYGLMQGFVDAHPEMVMDRLMAYILAVNEGDLGDTAEELAVNREMMEDTLSYTIQEQYKDYLDEEEHAIKTKQKMMTPEQEEMAVKSRGGYDKKAFIWSGHYINSVRAWFESGESQ